MSGYTIYLSRYDPINNPTACFEIGSLENNGIGNQSVPRQIVDSFFAKRKHHFALDEDLSFRFVPGFQFQAINSNSTHTYTVADEGSYVQPTDDNKLMTIIPVIEPLIDQKYDTISYHMPTHYTSLQLTGNGVPTYNQTTTWGNALLNNIIRMLEHFANDVPPVSPIEGQIWFNTVDKTPYVYDGNDWHAISKQTINVDLSSFARKDEIEDKINTSEAKALIKQVVDNISIPSVSEVAHQVYNRLPYDISLFVYEMVNTTNNIGASILLTRDVIIPASEHHTVRALTPPTTQASLELIKLTENHESAVGIITIGAASRIGNVNLYQDVKLCRGDLLVLRPLEIDFIAKNIFITLAGVLST